MNTMTRYKFNFLAHLVVCSIVVLCMVSLCKADDEQSSTSFTVLSTSALQTNQTAVLAIVTDVAPGLHTQSHEPLTEDFIKFDVTVDPNPSLEFLPAIFPKGIIVNFPELGNQSIYKGRVIVYVPIHVKAGAHPDKIAISGTVSWQACNDKVCFAPESNTFSQSTRIVSPTTAVTLDQSGVFQGFDQSVFAVGAKPVAAAASAPAEATADFFGRKFVIGSSNVPLALAIALAVGVLFNLMPCVLPVLPLKAIGFFEVSQHSRARCLALGTVFSLGVITVFAGLAILVVAFRASLHFSWGEQFKYGWFIWTIVALLVVMALGMLGLFEVVLPQKIYELTPSHESMGGNFLFGMLTAVLSTPCTAPMFAGILAWTALQPVALGVATIITVGVGMSIPYLLLSAMPGLNSRVPRTGPWSLVLKQMMGFLVLAVAVYFAGGRLSSDKEFFWAVFAVVALAMAFLVVRTFQLSRSILPILGSLVAAAAIIAVSLSVTLRLLGGAIWKPYTADNLSAARASGKTVLVEFTANWCGNCLALEASVYHDPIVLAALREDGVVLLRADLTQPDAPSWPEVNQLNPGGGIPLTVIYGKGTGDPIKLTSLYTPRNLIDALDKVKSGA
jgi:thiol:disulfide interchange protein